MTDTGSLESRRPYRLLRSGNRRGKVTQAYATVWPCWHCGGRGAYDDENGSRCIMCGRRVG